MKQTPASARPLKPPPGRDRGHRARHPIPEDEPILRFTPTAWARLEYLCHLGESEVGGFGLTDPDDPLRVLDLLLVKQRVSPVTVAFDDEAVADLFDRMVDEGIAPERFGRVWWHTHPGTCPLPSDTDEQTFARVFGRCDWAVMFILARGGASYARLRFNIGPGGSVPLDVAVDYSRPFAGSDHAAWEAEYRAQVHPADIDALDAFLAGPGRQLGMTGDEPLDIEHLLMCEGLEAGVEPV